MPTSRLVRSTAAAGGLALAVTLAAPAVADDARTTTRTSWAPTAHFSDPLGRPAPTRHIIRKTEDGTTSSTPRLHRRHLLVHPTKSTARGRYLDVLRTTALPAGTVWRPRAAREGAIPPSLVPAAAFTGDGSSDIDDDGNADLLEVQPLDRRGDSVRITLRRGSNGKARWHKSAENTLGFVALRQANGKHVFVVMTLEFSGPARPRDGDVVVVTLTLTAYDARTGDQKWLTTLTGDETFERMFGYPFLSGADGLPYPETALRTPQGDRLLFSELFLDGNPFRNQNVATEFTTVDANGGSIADAHVRVENDYVAALSVGDVTNDGYDDITTTGRRIDEFSGRTGRQLWAGTSRLFPIDTLRDATGDGRPDLLATSFGRVVLIDARTGHERWSHGGFFGFGVGDIDGDNLTDVVVEGSRGFRSKRVGAILNAVDARGDTVWHAAVTVKKDKGSFALIGVFGGTAGDTNNDGILEVAAGVFEEVSGHDRRTRIAVVDGATGKVDDRLGHRDPLYASLDGRGDDFVRVRNGAHWKAIVRDGRDWHEIFTFGRTGSDATRVDEVYATPLTDDDHAELVVSVHDFEHAATYVVDGSTHKVRWAIHT